MLSSSAALTRHAHPRLAILLVALCAVQPLRGAEAGVPLFPPTPPARDQAAADAAGTTAPTPPPPAPDLPPPPELETDFRPRPPRDTFEAQIALMRDAICPGSIDGIPGMQTRNAIVAFQIKHGLTISGMLDNETRAKLLLHEPPLTTYTVTDRDLARLRPLPDGWEAKARLDRLDYSSVLELVAEKSCTHPRKIKELNPQITDWEHIPAGTVVAMPHIFRSPPGTRPMRILISLSHKTLQVYDADSQMLAHFPCSIARRVEKRPVGQIEVVTIAPNPNYTFDPANFPDSAEAQRIGRKLILQPGPNNPVGVAWIGLSLPGYGIHGSPEPEQIGRTESAGCFRLANWNAEYLLPLVYPGLKIDVEP